MKALPKNYTYFLIFSILFFFNCSSSDADDPVSDTDEEVDPDPTSIIGLTIDDGTVLDFGEVVQNITRTKKVKISNSGNTPLEVSTILVPDGFSSDWLSGTIDAGAFKDINITFTPSEIKDFEGRIIIESNASSGETAINCLGIGISDIFDGDILFSDQQEIQGFIDDGYKEITGTLFIAYDSSNSVHNTSITSLLPLSKLRSIQTIRINSTSNLVNLDGLENVEIKGSIALVDNIGLENINGLKNLTGIQGFLQIAECHSLKNVDPLNNLVSIESILTITHNDLLENIEGLSSLKKISGDLELKFNPFINSLEGFNNLETIGGRVFIKGNQRLRSYCAIQSLVINGGIQDIFYALTLNKYNPKIEELKNGSCEADIPQGVYNGDVRLDNFPDYDFFVSFGYEEIDGNLSIVIGTINNRSITSLDDWSSLKKIKGDFIIENTSINNLEGLSNLELIDNNLEIRNNNNLSDYCAIVSLVQSGGIGNNYLSVDNSYNPTFENLQNGVCVE